MLTAASGGCGWLTLARRQVAEDLESIGVPDGMPWTVTAPSTPTKNVASEGIWDDED